MEAPHAPDSNQPRVIFIPEDDFSLIESGQKMSGLFEASSNFAGMKPGHTLELRTLGVKDSIKLRVGGIRQYKTLEDALAAENAGKIALGKSREELIKNSERRFKPEDVQKYGLTALDFEKI